MSDVSILTVIGWLVAYIGGAFFIAAAVGLLRFRDPYMRISAVSTATGIGLALVTIGAVLTNPTAGNLAMAVIAVILQLATSAIAGTLTARGAVNSGHPFTPETDLTALREADEEARGQAGPAVAGTRWATGAMPTLTRAPRTEAK